MSQATPALYRDRDGSMLDGLDLALLLASLLLITLGLIMVGSASLAIAELRYQEALALVRRQGLSVLVGLTAAAVAFAVPLRVWSRYGLALACVTLLALTVLVIPGVIDPINGASRWVHVFGFSLQPSELAKPVFLIFLAAHLQRKGEQAEHLQQLLLPALMLVGFIGLLLAQPDYGSAVVLFAVTLGVLFIASVKPLQLIGVGVVLVVPLALLAMTAGYRMNRLTCFLNPLADASGGCYQLVQSLIAINRGQLFGVGLGDSVQKLAFLPEAHNDFLLAILAEELGLIGVVVVVALYAIVVWRCFAISAAAERRGWRFAAFLVYGIGLLLALQALINIGVNLGVLPTKGLTLPLLSYGGSSMIAVCVALALVLRVHWELSTLRTRGSVAHSRSLG